MAPRLTEAHLNDPVTRHMRNDFVWLRTGQTVGEALAEMRQQLPEGRIIYFYVVDAEQRLQGVVPTRRLLLSPLDRPVADVMVRHVIAIPAEATVLDACEFFTLHRLLGFPVVDEERRLIGVVDVELYTEGLSEADAGTREEGRASDDLFQLIGVHVAQARQTRPLTAFRTRFPWLLSNVGAGIVAALISGLFEAELRQFVALSLFIPVVLALAESTSIQSVSLAVQHLHGGPPTWRVVLPRMLRELLVGLLLGGTSALIVGTVALLWIGGVGLLVCLVGGLVGGMAVAAVLGIATPNLLRLLKLDPRVAAGPLCLAMADIFTLLIYFNLARWLLR